MDPFIYDEFTDEYIDPEDRIFYRRTGLEVARILQNIIDALRSPYLQGRIYCPAYDLEEQEHYLGEIVKANRAELDRFGLLRVITRAISWLVFTELRSDHQKKYGRYGCAVDDGWGHADVVHSERDSVVYGYIRQIFQLVCPLFCDLFLICHNSKTLPTKAEPNVAREFTGNSASSFPVLLDLVNLVKSDQFTNASNHMESAFGDLCEYMNRMDLFN